MIFVIQLLDADIHMVMRDDMADLRGDRLNDGIKFQLPGKQPRNAHIMVKKSAFRRIQHVRTPSQASAFDLCGEV
ncbi:hypothetical protein D3C86_1310940 [compost metagenome]